LRGIASQFSFSVNGTEPNLYLSHVKPKFVAQNFGSSLVPMKVVS